MDYKYKYLVVGSGLMGSMFSYLAYFLGADCLVIDKRPHLGGNLYCENVKGINVHKYGAHIFHTSNDDVWRIVTSVVEFNRYTNSPLACYGNKYYNLPFNMNTFNAVWGVTSPDAAMKIMDSQKEKARSAIGDTPSNLEEQALLLVGHDIYEMFIKGYTEKQWGRSCKDLPADIIKRIPVRLTFDNNYFNDKYQGVPIGGYNRLIEGLLEYSTCKTSTDFFDSEYRDWRKYADKLLYTGPIDRYFGYCYGKLDWRSLRFEEKVFDSPNIQGNAVINYTSNQEPYTRVIEHKHFEMFGNDVYQNGHSVLTTEYPCEFKEGMEPYYPINDKKNTELFNKYRELAEKEEDVIFAGRLAEYKYYDMGPTVERAFEIIKKEFGFC